MFIPSPQVSLSFGRKVFIFILSMKTRILTLTVLAAALMVVPSMDAASFLWSANPPNGANAWSTGGNWTPSGPPGSADTVTFGNIGTTNNATGPDNVVSVNTTITTLNYTNAYTTGTSNHVTQIPSGVTLTVSGNVSINGQGSVDALTTVAAMTDAGTFVVNGTTFNVANNGSAASSALATLDLSGLSNFVYNASGGTINVASTGANRPGGLLILAGVSNNITANNINFFTPNVSNGGNGSSGIKFGSGTNIVNVGTFVIVQGKHTGVVQFNTVNGGLRIRGLSGNSDDTSRGAITIANRNSTGTGNTSGTLSLNGHPVDIKVSTLTMGQDAQTGGNSATGFLSFNQGTFDATTINMAIVGNGAVTGGTGLISVGTAGTLVANSISLVNQTAGAGGAGTLLVTNGGVLVCSNNIIKSTAAGTGTIVVTNSSRLTMLGGPVGSSATPIDTVTLNGATVEFAVANGVTNLVATTLNDGGTASTVNILAVPTVLGYPTQFPLIKYGGAAIGGGFNMNLGTLPGTFQGYISNDAVATVWLVITNGPAVAKNIVWQGTVTTGDWNTSTANWSNGSAVAYAEGDFVTFDDTAATNVVNLPANRSPGGFTNNSTANYTIVGSGITGSASLSKQGSGTLTLDNTGNTFSGGTTISGGTLQSGNNDANGSLPSGAIADNGTLAFNRTDNFTTANAVSGSGAVLHLGSGTNTVSGVNSYGGNTLISGGVVRISNAGAATGNSSLGSIAGGSVTITNGGTLDLSANGTANQLGFTNGAGQAKQFFIAGSGVGGNGAIVNNSGVNQQNVFQRITLTANATWGGGSRWDMRGNGLITPILDLNGFTLTKEGTNQMSMVGLITTNSGNIIINNGVLSFETASTFTNGAVNITVNPGGALGHFRQSGGFFTAPITLNGGAIKDLNGTPASTNDSAITLTANSFLDCNAGATSVTKLNGNITESGGSYGLTKSNANFFFLSGANTYSGNTIIIGGGIMLTNSGSLANTAVIGINSNATFNVAGLTTLPYILNSGQKLRSLSPGGAGTVNGAVTLASGASLDLNYTNGVASLNVTGGALTLNDNATTVTIAGSALAPGQYKVISKGTGGSVGGSVSASSVTVNGAGVAPNTATFLQITAGELFLAVNRSPAIANIVTNAANPGLTWKIAISALASAAGWSDLESDPITLTAVGPTSANSVSVTKDASFVYYNAPVLADDSFGYTISDGHSTANGTVVIKLSANTSPTFNIAMTNAVGGQITLNGASIPGRTNVIERTTNLTQPITWTPIFTNVVGTNGLWQVTDPAPSNPSYYRAVTQP